MALEHLFDVEMQYEGPIELAPLGLPQGKLVGGGKGRVEGPALKGTIRWANYERSLSEGLCSLQVPAVIETDDGAEIRLEALGQARVPDPMRPHLWAVALAFRFQTEDARYGWMNSALAISAGEFDMNGGRARHRVYGCIDRSE